MSILNFLVKTLAGSSAVRQHAARQVQRAQPGFLAKVFSASGQKALKKRRK